ncbi:MAG: SDR family oxidoreductase, partial [Myxococcales bacterium]|nr:SDR family oxidoreductase [Myxococcales bacterium]
MANADAAPQLLAHRRGVVLGVSGENSVGFACARLMSAMGAELTVMSRSARREVVEPLCHAQGWRWLPADYEDESSFVASFAAVKQHWERVDFLLHTIMDVPSEIVARPLVELRRADFERVMSAAAHSLVAACREALPLLSASSSPRVVALTSACSHRMTPNYHVAGIAKAALESTVLYLAWELGARGVLCNAVSFALIASAGAAQLVGAKA